MGKPTGFIDIQRKDRSYEPVLKRIKHYREFTLPLNNLVLPLTRIMLTELTLTL